MMSKRLAAVLCVLIMIVVATGALAGTTLTHQTDRNIKIRLTADQQGRFPVNPVIPGESPTTGLPWSGWYMPMLVQIDNADGGVGARAPWGASYADIIYEMILHKNGETRLTFLFSDEIPVSAGPVRSGRLGHVWLREEWDAGFLYYGGPKSEEVSISREFSKLGATKKGVLFNGTDGEAKPWKAFYNRVLGKTGPHNVNADVAAIQALIPGDHTAPARPFLFTDELPTEGIFADVISLNWPHRSYRSVFEYEYDTNLYYRYVRGEPYADDQTDEQIAFSNVIVQRVKVSFITSAQPSPTLVGKGNADIFTGGRYIAGYWARTAMDQRTIFFDADGNELKLQRGTTYIAVMAPENDVEFE
jgi:hypothetical protein